MLGLATKKDYKLVSVIGILFGALSLPILANLKLARLPLTPGSATLTVVGFFVFANFAMWIASLIGSKFPALFQFAKYAAAGALSAFIDLGVLNSFSLIFKIYSGPSLLIFNAISFLTATTNAYFWNKLWAFKKDGGRPSWREYLKFICITLTGLLINTAIVFFMTSVVGAPAGVSAAIWENVAKASAVIPNVMWNFVGYKFFIFKS